MQHSIIEGCKDENYIEFSDIANVSNIDYCIETIFMVV